MTMLLDSQVEEQRLAAHLADRVWMRASGRLEVECLRDLPRDVYFVGNLRPMPPDDHVDSGVSPAWFSDLLSKLAPVAFGSEFLILPQEGDVAIAVDLTWACYYRVFPTFSQQRTYQRSSGVADPDMGDSLSPTTDVSESTGEDSADVELNTSGTDPEAELTPRDRRHDRQSRESLFIRFRKVDCRASGVVRLRRPSAGGAWVVDDAELVKSVRDETERAAVAAALDPGRLRTAGSPDASVQVPATAMVSEASYEQFLASLTMELAPSWQWEIRTAARGEPDAAKLEVEFEFANATTMSERSPNAEPFLFDPNAAFRLEGAAFAPYELDQAPRGFRYDRRLWARGFNCAVVRQWEDTQAVLRTTNAPTYRQMRYLTSTSPRAPFAALATDPLPVLENILAAMKEYLRVWETEREGYRSRDPDWDERHGQEFQTDIGRYLDEVDRFGAGLNTLQHDPEALLAFRLTNEVFSRGPNDEWRIFQIVFLVCQVPGIAALNIGSADGLTERERVDIVYFPTGGGKTEAYLGVTVFHCFYDRLRGKSAGVTAWARFPLRLLTVQQMQRFADVIGMAELVRVEQDHPRLRGPDVDGFAVGYFVGQGGTPNELREARAGEPPNPDWSKAADPSARQGWKTIMRCPACRTTSVTVDFDEANVRLIHRCRQDNCRFPDGIIPVFVIDNEIYRYLPSVVVGTIDKLAALGNQRKFSLLLGEIDGRCQVHGYFKGGCSQTNCRDRKLLRPGAPAGVSGPSLFVQDELHLLREGLGTFDAHYETFTQRLLVEFGQDVPLKVIASSATIEAFDRQVEHLYGRSRTQARIFPTTGPTLGSSFYAETLDFPQRIFVGIMPHNKTIFNSILELLQYYQEEIQGLQRLTGGDENPYGGAFLPGTSEWRSLVDLYATSVSYFLASRDLNSTRTDLESHVNSSLQAQGLRPAEIRELTGSTTTDEVTRVLGHLEKPDVAAPANDIVLATSMISHGVDIDRLNAMFFYGMPRQNAEYIQASSRVGRSHPGIVFNCLHPARERDQSQYSYFLKFHEYLGQLVEPVAINRWSKFSVERTLPGLFMAVLLQLIANRSGNDNPNRYYRLDLVKREISAGRIRAEHFIPILQGAYTAGAADQSVAERFSGEIAVLVRQFLDQIISAGVHEEWVSDALYPRPMSSLREVDESLDVELDEAGTRWGNRSR